MTNVTKAQSLPEARLTRVKSERLRLSLELQAAFGLRREECLKFQPTYALAGQSVEQAISIQLAPSWCKGGRAREIPVRSAYQRGVLQRALLLAGDASMIPPEKQYVEWLGNYEQSTRRAGLSKMHGLRHQYAQALYRQLTGWEAPACGGPRAKELTHEQKESDHVARLQISQELGHNREAITAIYLGR